ncbi:chemotaxis-specific protein-glutamate methyltransferase CheB [Allocoleopsis sp.]|uniref:chemotaxis-specific protein-glutamate methyltransferase CheB n=1 Tax=Allocoleopsis sp. TaxID=3088169 RepID=UPI002FD188CB
MTKKIRVLLVEDSKITLLILRKILNSSPQIEVVGEARTGLEALEVIPHVQPDVICTDLHMPQMDGLEFTSEVMTLYPRPILVISSWVHEEDSSHVFQLLEAGALDIFPKPSVGLTMEDKLLNQELINKIQILSGVKVFKKKRKFNSQVKSLETFSSTSYLKPEIIAIGASTGGPQAINELFAQLPSNFPVPVICVQHICFGFLQGFIDWLASRCQLPIQIAKPGDIPKSGIIYFPPEQHHLELNQRGQFICSHSPPFDGHRPSVTVTFKSVAKFYGKAAVGILLTGMGKDGAEGMQCIAQAGGLTIAQDETTSAIFGMPKQAIDLGAAKLVLPIHAIAPKLLEVLQRQPPLSGKHYGSSNIS